MTQPTLRTESLFNLTWPIFLQHVTHGIVWLVDFWFFSHLGDEVAATVGQLLPILWMGAGVIMTFAARVSPWRPSTWARASSRRSRRPTS